jgi:very-short-patch-repair endonuclease
VPRIIPASRLVDRDLGEEGLVRVLRGFYATPPPAGAAPWEVDRYLLLARAAALHRSLTGEHWFSGQTAALLWGCAVVRVPRVVDVVTRVNPHVRTGAMPGVRRHWTARPERAADASRLLALPASSLARTVVECASSLPPREGLVVADSALRSGTDPVELSAALEASAGDRGVRRARAVVAWADDRSESAGESLVRYELLRAGAPPPELQVPVRTRHGWRWIDLGWPAERVGLEFDGRAKYGATANDVAAGVVAEKRRQEALEDAGWRILRLGWDDLGRPDDLVARVQRALRRATRSRRTV